MTEMPRKFIRYLQRKVDGSYRPNRWFNIDARVRAEWVPSLHPRYIPNGDVVIATAWQTAEWLGIYPAEKGKKACLVYDFEHYMSASPALKERIGLALTQPMKAIATSPAVAGMLTACGADVTAYIPNGVDLDIFLTERSFSDPERDSVGFPTRREPFKGTKDAIRALSMVGEKFTGDLRFWSFGGSRPSYVPAWIEYYKRPSDKELRQLYNRTLVFAVPSHYEGWGLPGAEAMACGAVLASTDNGGVRAYARHGCNALLSPPGNAEALAANILQLLNDSTLRMRLAQQGHSDIREFTWPKAIDSMEQFIEELCGGKQERPGALHGPSVAAS